MAVLLGFSVREIMTKKQENCEHDFRWNYDCFEDAVIKDTFGIGIPVKCRKCGLEGIEWYIYSNVRDKKGNLIEN